MTPAVPLPWVSTPAAPPTVLPNRTEAEFYVASVCFKHGPPRLLGAELEWVVQHSGNPHLPLQARHLADVLGPHVPQYLVPASSQQPLPYGSTVTVEPGGQLEISSPPCASLAELIATAEGDTAALTDLLDPAGLVLTGSGSDPHRPSRWLIDIPRYAAMKAAEGGLRDDALAAGRGVRAGLLCPAGAGRTRRRDGSRPPGLNGGPPL